MEGYARYRHLHVDWVGELATESITLCGGANEDSGTEQTLCPNCAQVRDALNVCGLGPESLRELFDMLRVIDPSEVKAKMEADTHTPSETEQVTMPRMVVSAPDKTGKNNCRPPGILSVADHPSLLACWTTLFSIPAPF